MPCATCATVPAQPRAFFRPMRCRCSARWRRPLQRRRRHRLYQALVLASERGLKLAGKLPLVSVAAVVESARHCAAIPAHRYLAEIADSVRGYHARGPKQQVAHCPRAPVVAYRRRPFRCLRQGRRRLRRNARLEGRRARSRPANCSTCGRRPSRPYSGDEYVVKDRDKEIRTASGQRSLSGQDPKVILPDSAMTAKRWRF